MSKKDHLKHKIMAQTDRIYKKFIRKNFSNFDGNYPPSSPIEIGSFGLMEKGFFKKHGDLYEDFDIAYKIDADDTPSDETFKAEGSVSVKIQAKGDIGSDGLALLKAQIELDFSSKKSLFFSSMKVKFNKIDSLREVGNRIIDLYNNKKWNKNYVVVTSVMDAGKTLVLISGSNNGKVVIGAKSDSISTIDLAKLDGDIEIKSSSNVSYEILTDHCQLGFGLSRLQDSLLSGPGIKSVKGMIENVEYPDDDKTMEHEELLFENVKPGTYDEKNIEKTLVEELKE